MVHLTQLKIEISILLPKMLGYSLSGASTVLYIKITSSDYVNSIVVE